MDTNPRTLTRHILAMERLHPEATGDLTQLLQSIQLACKTIAAAVRRAGMIHLYGATGEMNVQGEQVQILDDLANQAMCNALSFCGQVSILTSEEMEKSIIIDRDTSGKYVVAFDPLDGSSNIDCNASIGTIFGVHRKPPGTDGNGSAKDALQPGSKLVAAGYCMYGAATIFVIALSDRTDGFTLDPSTGEFILTHEKMSIIERGPYYSINEGNAKKWDEATKMYVNQCKFPEPHQKGKSLRYVSDVHRTLIKGGIFCYPADSKSPNGKLRLCYEVNPMAFVIKKAGGKAFTAGGKYYGDPMDVQPEDLHQRLPCFLGSSADIDEIIRCYEKQKMDTDTGEPSPKRAK